MHPTKSLQFGGSVSSRTFLQITKQKNVLGALCFSANADLTQSIKTQSKIPCLQVPMPSLSEDEAVCEYWSGSGSLKQAIHGDIHYQYDDEVLFGVMQLSEADFKPTEAKTSLQQATESAYRQIFALTEQLNFPHIFRFWNYIPDINANSHELERYRQFNLGRYEAFLAFQRDVVGNVPAACALGFNQRQQESGLSIAFLAGRIPPEAIENPRQISAYEYPEQYGPVSPTFSRASLIKLKQSELLLISGTASIVGHATQHVSDAVIQAREAMTNIEAILGQANTIASNTFALVDLHYRVYVRHPAHVPEIQDELMRYIGPLSNVAFFHAEICRQDLLLEIEASAEHSFTSWPVVED